MQHARFDLALVALPNDRVVAIGGGQHLSSGAQVGKASVAGQLCLEWTMMSCWERGSCQAAPAVAAVPTTLPKPVAALIVHSQATVLDC